MDLNALFHNEVRLRGYDRHGGLVHDVRAKNQMTFAWAGVVISALLRSGPSQVTHLYARFGDSGANPGTLSPANNDLRYTVRGDFLASSDGVRGGLWVPLQAPPQQSSDDSGLYVGNIADYPFWISGNIPTSQVSPSNNFNAASSYIYALGLAVAVSTLDRTQDLIVGVLQSFDPFQVPSGGQELVNYPLKLTTNLPSA